MAYYEEELSKEEEALSIIRDNLLRLDRQRGEETDKRLAHLEDIVKLLGRQTCQSGVKRNKTLLWMLNSEAFSQTFRRTVHRNLPEETNKDAASFYHDISRCERLYICRRLIQIYSEECMRQIWEFLSSDLPIEESMGAASEITGRREPEFRGRVVHMKNAYSEKAFSFFQPYFSDFRVSTIGDLQNICEMVYHGRAEYCVLPLENSTDGRLHRFYYMLDQYDLKIIMACNVTSADGDMTTKFGLAGRQLQSWNGKRLNGRIYMDCSVILSEQNLLHDILTSAEECGYSLHRVDALPIHGDNKEFCFHLTFQEMEGADLPLLLLYLQLETVQSTILGIYGYLI